MARRILGLEDGDILEMRLEEPEEVFFALEFGLVMDERSRLPFVFGKRVAAHYAAWSEAGLQVQHDLGDLRLGEMLDRRIPEDVVELAGWHTGPYVREHVLDIRRRILALRSCDRRTI